MTDTSPTNGSVSFTTKELIAKLDGKLDTVILKLDAKADRDDMKHLEGRVTSLETQVAQAKGQSGYSRWVVPVTISIVSIGVTLATILVRLA